MTNTSETTSSKPTGLLGLHHFKLAAKDLKVTYDFYIDVFSFTPLSQLDHRDKQGNLFAALFEHTPTKLRVEVRQNRPQAEVQARWDPITWRVAGRQDLEEWAAFLDSKGVKHSRVLKGAQGWVLVAEDPDGKFVKLYTDEEHEWTSDFDQGECWLGNQPH